MYYSTKQNVRPPIKNQQKSRSMKLEEPPCFPCHEAGCTGTITDDPQYSVTIRTGCCATSQATRCPVCGRLHWPNGGDPVQSRAYEKVFSSDGNNLENRPLESSDRLSATRNLFEGARRKDLVPEYYTDKIRFLIALGHAPDCPAAKSTGDCVCGITEADKWLLDNASK